MSNDNSKLPHTKATFDPGWNDPPMFSYDAIPPSAAGKSKLNLNKRVAFPLQSSETSISSQMSTPLSSSGLPMPFSGSIISSPTCFSSPPRSSSNQGIILPPPSTSVQQSIVVKQECATKLVNDEINNDNRQSYIFTILDRTITSLSLTNNTYEFNEIIKRINILKSSYDQLDFKIQSILYKIANSIDKKNISEATNFHRSLAVDYLNVCSQWAPALRQLILLVQPNDIIERQSNENEVHFYSSLSNDSTTANRIPASQQEDIAQKSAAKHNFSKIYHI